MLNISNNCCHSNSSIQAFCSSFCLRQLGDDSQLAHYCWLFVLCWRTTVRSMKLYEQSASLHWMQRGFVIGHCKCGLTLFSDSTQSQHYQAIRIRLAGKLQNELLLKAKEQYWITIVTMMYTVTSLISQYLCNTVITILTYYLVHSMPFGTQLKYSLNVDRATLNCHVSSMNGTVQPML